MSTKNYIVYFEIYGKKMKAKVLAESMTEVQQKVKDKIIFHKTMIEEKDEFNQAMDVIDGIILKIFTLFYSKSLRV